MSNPSSNLTRLRDLLRHVQGRLITATMAVDDGRPDHVMLELERSIEVIVSLVDAINEAIVVVDAQPQEPPGASDA